MALPLSTARAAKSMPGHYGHSKKAGAKKASAKKSAAKKPAAKKPAAGKKAAGSKKALPPSFLKNMKKKSAKK